MLKGRAWENHLSMTNGPILWIHVMTPGPSVLILELYMLHVRFIYPSHTLHMLSEDEGL